MKREINTQWIYSARPNRPDAFKAADWARLVDYLSGYDLRRRRCLAAAMFMHLR